MAQSSSASPGSARQRRMAQVGVPVAIVAIVVMLVVPLPAMLLDLLIAGNITAAAGRLSDMKRRPPSAWTSRWPSTDTLRSSIEKASRAVLGSAIATGAPSSVKVVNGAWGLSASA